MSIWRSCMIFIVFTHLAWTAAAAAEKTWLCSSPSGELQIEVFEGKMLTYRVLYRGKEIIQPSRIAMEFSHVALGSNAEVLESRRREEKQKLMPVVPSKNAFIDDHFHELVLKLRGDYQLVLRAYNDAVAYRIITEFDKDEVMVTSETAEFRFNGNYRTLYLLEPAMFTHFEQYYIDIALRDIDEDKMAFLPVYLAQDDIRLLIMEADLYSYPGMFVAGDGRDRYALRGRFAPYPKKEGVLKQQVADDRDFAVVETAGFIARTTGKRAYPWRVLVVRCSAMQSVSKLPGMQPWLIRKKNLSLVSPSASAL